MRTIAITGGIACGKSLAGSYISELGVPVCEADEVAREVLRKGEAVRERVVAEFGPDVVLPGGEIDRKALAGVVFGDSLKRERLNALMHPEIMKRVRVWVAGQSGRAEVVAAVIPLLFEVHDESNWDVVVCVTTPEVEQKRRLMARGLTVEASEMRIRAQLGLSEKMEKSDYVVFNGGSQQLLREQVERVMRSIRGG